jgi:FkbM family methyltransferase
MDIRQLKTRVHSLLHRCGFDIVPYSGRYFPSKRRIETMYRTGVSVVIDVGANRGQFVDELRGGGWHGPVVSIEPHPSAYAVLADRADADHLWSTINVAVGAKRGAAVLNLADNDASSSILPMTDRHRAVAPESRFGESIEVVVETIDSVVEDRHLDGTFYLKIDTQGYELEVLRGAVATLEACAAVELELSLEELYEGQPLMADVSRWLLDQGFIPIAQWPILVDPGGAPLQMDAIFVRA